MIYTTRSLYPHAVISQIHYAELTDLAWNLDKRLCVSSQDGYVTVINFDDNELGRPLQFDEIGENVRPLFDWMIHHRDLNLEIQVPQAIITPTFTSRKTGTVVLGSAKKDNESGDVEMKEKNEEKEES